MKIKQIFSIIIILILIFAGAFINLYGDWLWFGSINFQSVFWTILSTQLAIGIIAAVVFFVFAYLNLRLVKRVLKSKRKNIGYALIIIIGIFAIFIGIGFSSGWLTPLLYSNSTPFGITDPIFANDISFYIFELPYYYFILNYVMITIVFTMIVSFIGYLVYSKTLTKKKKKVNIGEMDEEIEVKEVKTDLKELKRGFPHIFALAGILFLFIAGLFFLKRFDVLFSSGGVVFGAGYTDIVIYLPLMTIMTVVSIIVAVLFFVNIKVKKNLAVKAVWVFIGVLILGGIAGTVFQGIIVEPDEFNLEKDYIERNIENTLMAYGLGNVDEQAFPVSYNLTGKDMENEKATVDNIRLWDWRPLLKTYNQLQIFRTYYNFDDIDIDRYNIDGEYRQVMLSPRELKQESLPSRAQTWINQHMVYTHGYGVAMSPVNLVSEQGLPELYVKDIPPKSEHFDIQRPEIYYGEQTDDFVVVDTKTDELDYPQEEENVYTTYAGTGGVSLTSLFDRLVYAVKFGSIELLASGSLKPESKILFNRRIDKRVVNVAPFLLYDADPYIVISEGKLYWIYDAYTVTGSYPYSEPVPHGRGVELNYIRNSVKVVIDAYNGNLDYYIIDEEDPVINTYAKIFPDLFSRFSDMPSDLQEHIRYPESLFIIQTDVYSTYHMRDPRVFYNKEDQWKTPDEIYRSRKQPMSPYYVIMKLPGREKEEFIMMIPFTPRGKENMIGWMAAKSDQPEYGKIVAYMFSKQELIYGPMQIEARIDQDTEISQRITLWSQAGSDVIRGNTLVIPIKDSIIYVEPLYLQATETAVPELKRVIVAYGTKVSMKETLESALTEMFGIVTEPETPSEEPAEKTRQELIAEASQLYASAQAAQMAGNWAEYGQDIEKLGEILNQLTGME